MRRTAYIALTIGLAGLVALVANQGARDVLDALRVGGWPLMLLLPLHLLPQLPDAASWRTLIDGPRSLARLYWIAWIRQAVGRLLPVAGIGGELVGIRLLLQGGVAAAPAVASVVVEVLTTLLAQCLFVLLGALCVLQVTGAVALVTGLLLGLTLMLPLLALLLVLLRRGSIFGRLHRMALRLIGREPQLASLDASDRIDAAIIALCRDPRRMTLATGLQLLGMVVGCLEIWAAFDILGAPISLPEALLVEALNQTAKHLIFFIPGALGVQELTFMALSSVIGVHADVALAVSLAKRAVDVLVGVPALVSWQWAEGRRWAARTVP